MKLIKGRIYCQASYPMRVIMSGDLKKESLINTLRENTENIPLDELEYIPLSDEFDDEEPLDVEEAFIDYGFFEVKSEAIAFRITISQNGYSIYSLGGGLVTKESCEDGSPEDLFERAIKDASNKIDGFDGKHFIAYYL